ncbi:MAG TPA: hypothetical protein ENJ33_08890 [Thiothrix sp.]|nr:hypothetical protein [Thiothrix sp.]
MRFFQKTVISLMIAASLTACSDNKNEKKESATTEAVVTSQAKTSDKFSEMLAYVPADTAYLMANSVAVPDDVLEFQMKRFQMLVSALSANIKSITDVANKMPSEDSDSSASTEAKETSDATKEATKEEPNAGDFIKALLQEFSTNLNKDGLAKLGLKFNGHSMFYALDMLPVIRYELANKEAFKALLSKAEKTSGYKLEWSKCGEHDCLVSKKGKELNIATVFVGDHVAIAPFSSEKKQQVMDHLLGTKKPEKSYKVADWNTFVSENGYKGYGEGFVKLNTMLGKLEQFLLTKTKQEQGDSFDEQAFKGCFAVVKAHTKNVPELVFGIKELSEKAIKYEVVVKTAPEVSTVLQGLPNKLTDMKQPTNPIFTLGVNMNMPNLRNALTQYVNFLATSGEEHKCAAINPVELRKSIGGLAMAMTMGASQFKSIFVALDNLELDNNGKPSKVEAFGTVVADDPMALLQMLAMVNPQFATLQLPDNGKPVKLPVGVIPAGLVSPELSLSRQGRLLNMFVGNDQMALEPISVKENTIFWNVTDSKRYYGLMNKVIEQAPETKGEKTKEVMEVMNALGEFSGVMSQQIGFDKRGVVLDYSISY